jgi:hypothetical protein
VRFRDMIWYTIRIRILWRILCGRVFDPSTKNRNKGESLMGMRCLYVYVSCYDKPEYTVFVSPAFVFLGGVCAIERFM